MSNTSLADHIRSYAGALGPEQCHQLIERFEASSALESCACDGSYSFTQLDITAHWPDQHKLLVPILLACFARYQADLTAGFWPPSFAFEHLRIKRYLPNGRDAFPPHVDVMGQRAARRFMTAIVYLNHVIGGETVFPALGLSVAPEVGKLIAFPPLWLFPHAGLPPREQPKYILHTYLCYPD
jgi:hypothetical protein